MFAAYATSAFRYSKILEKLFKDTNLVQGRDSRKGSKYSGMQTCEWLRSCSLLSYKLQFGAKLKNKIK